MGTKMKLHHNHYREKATLLEWSRKLTTPNANVAHERSNPIGTTLTGYRHPFPVRVAYFSRTLIDYISSLVEQNIVALSLPLSCPIPSPRPDHWMLKVQHMHPLPHVLPNSHEIVHKCNPVAVPAVAPTAKIIQKPHSQGQRQETIQKENIDQNGSCSQVQEGHVHCLYYPAKVIRLLLIPDERRKTNSDR